MIHEPSVLDSVNKWVELNWLRHLDRAFGGFLLNQEVATNNLVPKT